MSLSLFSNSSWEKNAPDLPNRLWSWVKFAILTLPLFPNLGSLALLASLGWTGKRHFQPIRRSPLSLGFAMVSVWLILTTLFAVKPVSALEGLANFIPYFIVFLIFRSLFKTFDQLHQLAWWFILSSLPVTLLGFGQLLGWESWPILKILGTNLVAYGNPEGRMSSVLMYANTLAAFLLTPFVLSVGLSMIYYQQWRQKPNSPTRNKLLILLFALILNGIALILTNSRSAWGLLFLITLCFAFYVGWHWLVWGLGTAAASIMWAAWGTIGQEPLRKVIPAYFWARLSDDLYPDRSVPSLRLTQWQFAWDMGLQRPGLGWGLRNFSPYYKSEMNLWLGHPHNFYLMLFAEVGVIGTLLFCGLIGYIVGQGVYYYTQLGAIKKGIFPEKTLLFSYLLVFLCCMLFNGLDVTVFDFRVNLTNWLVLAAMSGVVSQQQKEQKLCKN